MKVAKQISKDIQEILVSIVSASLHIIQADIAQHESRLDGLKQHLQAPEDDNENILIKLQEAIQKKQESVVLH